MKQDQHTTLSETRTPPAAICHWVQTLVHLHARLAPRFARPEPRRRVLAYLQGILSDTSRKNGWQLAEHAGEARPDGMQRLLSHAVWDTDGVRDDLRCYALEQLGHEEAILAIDETSFPKRGNKSAGVGVQYCGTTGQVENCQVGVFLADKWSLENSHLSGYYVALTLASSIVFKDNEGQFHIISYVTAKGHTLIDRDLYLPFAWCEDQDRRRAAHIPETVRFQTKPELAIQMMERMWHTQIPIAWVVADSVYGGNLDLRNWLEAHQYAYVLAVPCNEPIGFQTQAGRRREEAALVAPFVLLEGDWQCLSMSEGTKGSRCFDWAIIPMLHRWQDDGCHWLLIRRSLSDPFQKTYYVVFAPKGTSVPEMVKAIGARWRIEEDFENAKDMGLDHYEVRSFVGWYRHITLVLLALAYLTGMCAMARSSPAVTAPAAPSPARHPLLPLTVPEVRHLLARLIWPASSSVTRVLAWSWWRRGHQHRARSSHIKRRLKARSAGGDLTPRT